MFVRFLDCVWGLTQRDSLFLCPRLMQTHTLDPDQEAVSSNKPLADVLCSEGLKPLLQSVVLYGIAMADWTQQQAASTQHSDKEAQPCLQQDAQHSTSPSPLDARSGCASLALYTNSLGRFGSPGAFMVPSYGAGERACSFECKECKGVC